MVADEVAGTRRLPEDPIVVGARVAVVVSIGALGALFALGSLVAVLFELQGFGDQDGDPDAGYLALQAAGLALSVTLPLLVWRWLLPRSFSPAAAVIAFVFGLAGVAWMLGAGL